MNAVKLDKVFAKPFLGALDGHRDGITCVCKHPAALSTISSAAADGEIRLWQLATRWVGDVFKSCHSSRVICVIRGLVFFVLFFSKG